MVQVISLRVMMDSEVLSRRHATVTGRSSYYATFIDLNLKAAPDTVLHWLCLLVSDFKLERVSVFRLILT